MGEATEVHQVALWEERAEEFAAAVAAVAAVHREASEVVWMGVEGMVEAIVVA